MPDYLTASELAARVRLSRDRVYKLARAGVLPSVRLVPKGKLLFDLTQVEAVLRSHAGNTAPHAASRE
jgi:excisionase family DNA binding protein